MMRNENGSILVATMGFVLFFTLLGLGSIYHAMIQNEMAEEQRFSAEAFWLADAGIEEARSKLQKATPIPIPETKPAVNLGDGSYDVFSMPDPAYPTVPNRWLIHSTGTVQTKTRIIRVILANHDIKNAITTEDIVKAHRDENDEIISLVGNDEIDINSIEEHAEFSFETVFNGLTEQDFHDMAEAQNHLYLDPGNAMTIEVTGVTWIDVVDDPKVKITNETFEGSGLLIVDTRNFNYPGNSPNSPELDIEGGVFYGIIWVLGECAIHGNMNMYGAMFIQEGTEDETETPLSGTPNVVYDPEAIEMVIGDIYDDDPEWGIPSIIVWVEL